MDGNPVAVPYPYVPFLAVHAVSLPYAGAAHADRNRVAEFAASGLLFKDQVEVTALDDPESEWWAA